MGKNYEELTAGLDRTTLPATRVDPEKLVLFPEATVGDEVVVHSRGYHRVAVVLESTPKRVMVAYTTEGAWKEAVAIYEYRMARGPESAQGEKQTAEQAAKNYDYYTFSATEEAVEAGLAKHPTLGRDYFVKDRQRAIQRLAEMGTKEEEVAAEVAKYRESIASAYAEAKEKGAAGFVNITTKSVKRTEVYRAKAAV